MRLGKDLAGFILMRGYLCVANKPLMIAVWLINIVAAFGDPLVSPDGPSIVPAADWLKVSERVACEAMQDDYCLGRYGFTINSDGTFVAGPSSKGRKTEGRIQQTELQQLGALIRQIPASASNEERRCNKGGLPGIKDQIDLTFGSGWAARIYDLGGSVGKLCYTGRWDNVHRLHKYVHKLMTRYYPVPFPKGPAPGATPR
jgi:hypothetical protein